MGGSSGGSININDVASLQKIAKQKLKEASNTNQPHVFISFAFEDIDEINLLRGQAKNEKTELDFADYSVKEAFDSENSEYIKSKIKEKIEKVSVTIVYLTKNSAKSKWVDWEIQESVRQGKGVIGVYKGDLPPDSIPYSFDKMNMKIVQWTHDNLIAAISAAPKNRT